MRSAKQTAKYNVQKNNRADRKTDENQT